MRLERFKDVVEYPYPALDSMQFFIGKKGFMDWLKSLDREEVLEFAKQYPVWRDRKLRECALIRFEREQDGVKTGEYEYRVYVPKLRALRWDYYLWVRKLELPKGYYRFITLTLGRWIDIVDAWKNINRWISRCLHRVRNRLRRDFGVEVLYLWVIEAHKDGYPHVHLLLTVSRYVPGLTFEYFLGVLWDAWVDDEGRALCEPQGVDVKYVGTDVERIRDYLLKYLVKDHEKLWTVEVRQGLVRVRLCALLIWVFKVRLFGFSQKIKRPVQVKRVCDFMGRVSVYRLWRFVFSGMEYRDFYESFVYRGREKVPKDVVPILLMPYSVMASIGLMGCN
jgi:hypothetical protein